MCPVDRRSYSLGILAILAGAMCWSTAGVLFKFIDLPPLTISLYRSLFCCLFLALVAGRGWSRVRPASIGVILSYAFTVNLFVVANKSTTAANAILLQSTAPVWVILLGAILERRWPRAADVFAVGGALVGLLLVLAERVGPTGGRGNAVALASGFCFGLMMILMRRQRATPLLQTLALGNLAAVLLALPWVWPDFALTSDQLCYLILLGAGQLGLGYLLLTVAIRRLPALEVALFALIEPVLNPVWVFIARGERPGSLALLGGATVILVIAFHAVTTARRYAGADR